MKIFITGICGFVGSNLANKLYDHSVNYVSGCDNLQFGYAKNLLPGINWIEKDFKDISEVELNKYDILIHCATSNIIYAQENQLDTFKTNAFESIKLIEKFNGKVIYTSTSSIYGQAKEIPTQEDCPENLTNAYDQSKCIVEKYLKLRGNFTTLRLSNVYGKNQRPENKYCGVVGKFIDQILNDKTITINGDGTDTRDYTYIDDVVWSLIIAIESNAVNTEINIGTGVETSSLKLPVVISSIIGKHPIIEFIDKRFIDKINRRCLDISKAEKILGWKPNYDLNEGLKLTINWQKNETGRY